MESPVFLPVFAKILMFNRLRPPLLICLLQVCQEPVAGQDQPEHAEGRGPADQPRAGRGGPPEPAGPAHMAGHQPCVLQQGRHQGERHCSWCRAAKWWVKQPVCSLFLDGFSQYAASLVLIY